MKSLVIYHDNCADGFGAAFAAWLKLGDAAEYLPQSYGLFELGSMEYRDREVYILDFSFSRAIMDDFFQIAKRVVWLDHHKTAFEAFGINSDHAAYGLEVLNETTSPHYVVLHPEKSGAYLAWEYFHPRTEVPLFIRHIDDYDRWQFKIEGTKAFNKALWSYAPWSFDQWKEMFWNEAHNEEFSIEATGLIGEGEAILRAHEQNVQAVVNGSARECTMALDRPVADYYGLAANCPPHLTSDVGHELATQSGTFGLCWTLSKEGLVAKCSLRSNGEYDVSAIAKSFGGGGHRNAAGFQVDIQVLLGWLK